MDDKKKLKFVKYIEKQNLRFYKADKKYGSPELKAIVKKDPGLEPSYRDYVLAVSECHKDIYAAGIFSLVGFVLLILCLVVDGLYFSVGIFWGLGLFYSVCYLNDETKMELYLKDFFVNARFHNYDSAIDVVNEACRQAKKERVNKTKEDKKEKRK